MNRKLDMVFMGILFLLCTQSEMIAQISIIQDFKNFNSAPIGNFQGINFREAGFSALYPIAGTDGKEFWTCSDRGVNIDAANANLLACRPTYDKIYSFPNYAPKIHRIRLRGDSIQILQTITMKRPNGSTATGIINPTGYGSTAAEVASTDTVMDCSNFNNKITSKDTFGIDSEGLVVDQDGNFWICEEGGPAIWKLNKNGEVIKRFTPYANLPTAQSIDILIDTAFKYRKNNRGFEGISITPNGKIYVMIQSPLLYPTKTIGEATRIHRMLEIDPITNATNMFVYLNDGVIGASGPNQIRLRDWKIGDMTAINNNEFLVLEAALRGKSNFQRVYKIDISNATPVNSGLYSGVTLEALVNQAGLTANGIVPVAKTLFMDLPSNGWPIELEKAEGIAIINDSTIAIGNDNDYGQVSLPEDGIASATGILSHIITFSLKGSNKISNYVSTAPLLAQGQTGPSTKYTPYILPSVPNAKFTSILTAPEKVTNYTLCGIPDGLGAFDNNDGTFTLLVNHELPSALGKTRAHGSKGAFVSKWIVDKSTLAIVSGSDLVQQVKLWNGSGYNNYNAANPSSLAAMSRLCSADLPEISAFYNASTGLGTQVRIFMNGEESGIEGRTFGHIATGVNTGNTYELPYLGKAAWENAVASPYPSNKTIVGQMDDGAGGQVYFYIGTKKNKGTEMDKAGLTNGKLYGIKVSGMTTETSATFPSPNTAFSLVDFGQVQNMTGLQLNNASINAGVTSFLRPEDGAWDPSNPNDFYFVTTNSFSTPSRLWKLHFDDIANPGIGGTITALLDGTEGHKMLDNLTIDQYGHILLMEDVGNNAHIGKIWQYNIATDALLQVAHHDPSRFLNGAPEFLTQDEEASGMIDVQSILGQGMFLLVDQAHYPIPGEVVEGGQLLAFFNPDTYNAAPKAFEVTGGGDYCYEQTGLPVALSNSELGKNYQLKLNGTTNVGSPIPGTGSSISFGNQSVSGVYSVEATSSVTGATATMIGTAIVNQNPAMSVDAGSNQMLYLGYSATSCAALNATNLSGGTPPYTIWWSTSATSSGINVCPVTTTNYYVSIRDNKGCKAKDSVKVCIQDVICDNTLGAKKILICHSGSTLCVSENEVATHLSHGDYLGTCGANLCDNSGFSRMVNNAAISEMSVGSLRVYPNPITANSIVEFKIDTRSHTKVQVFDLTGALIATLFDGEANENTNYAVNVNASSWKEGIYILKMVHLNQVQYLKFVK